MRILSIYISTCAASWVECCSKKPRPQSQAHFSRIWITYLQLALNDYECEWIPYGLCSNCLLLRSNHLLFNPLRSNSLTDRLKRLKSNSLIRSDPLRLNRLRSNLLRSNCLGFNIKRLCVCVSLGHRNRLRSNRLIRSNPLRSNRLRSNRLGFNIKRLCVCVSLGHRST